MVLECGDRCHDTRNAAVHGLCMDGDDNFCEVVAIAWVSPIVERNTDGIKLGVYPEHVIYHRVRFGHEGGFLLFGCALHLVVVAGAASVVRYSSSYNCGVW